MKLSYEISGWEKNTNDQLEHTNHSPALFLGGVFLVFVCLFFFGGGLFYGTFLSQVWKVRGKI